MNPTMMRKRTTLEAASISQTELVEVTVVSDTQVLFICLVYCTEKIEKKI